MTGTADTRLLTVTRRFSPTGVPSSADSLPTLLLTQSVRRLRVVVLLIVFMTAIGWVGVNTMEGDFLDEFRRPGDWVPPVVGLLSSLGIYLLTRSSRFGVVTILKFGLAYEVLVSFGIASGQYWNTFQGLSGERLTPDLVGASPVALWMACFTVLVPSKPRHALVALVLSGAAVPSTMAVLIHIGNAPEPPASSFFTIFVLPYLITTFVCMVCARVVYGLGREASAAQRLGSYELQTPLGSGGMGTVWRAHHDHLARPAAIKLIRREALSTDPVTQRSVISRFEREAQITASLESPHTVALYDFGISDSGDLFYVMELLDGIDLERFVRQLGPLPDGRVIHILGQACESLAEAHERGLVHRDVKPANLMLCERALRHDFLKVLDFGLARHWAAMEGAEGGGLGGRSRAGFLGTPAYVAPECIVRTDAVDGRSDLYSLGAVGYWLIAGRPPFEETTLAATLDAHLNTPPTSPGNHAATPTSPELDAVILRCLSKSPTERPSSALELREMLEGISPKREWTQARARDWWQSQRALFG